MARFARQFWLVKFDPNDDDNDPDEFFHRGTLTTWRVTRPPKNWANGDGVFFWEMSPTLAVVGIGEFQWPLPEKDWRGRTRFEVKHLSTRLRMPVGIEELRGLWSLRNAAFLKAGPQGTVFPVDQSQAADIHRRIVLANNAFARVWSEFVPKEVNRSLR
jgi:hypothetical protein